MGSLPQGGPIVGSLKNSLIRCIGILVLDVKIINLAQIQTSHLPSLELTAKAPENRPFHAPKGSRIVFQPSIFRCENVSFRVLGKCEVNVTSIPNFNSTFQKIGLQNWSLLYDDVDSNLSTFPRNTGPFSLSFWGGEEAVSLLP